MDWLLYPEKILYPTDAGACDLDVFGLAPAANAYVLHIFFALLLLSAAFRGKHVIGIPTFLIFLIVSFMTIVLQRGVMDLRKNAGFHDVLIDAQGCANDDPSIPWKDGSTLWVYNVPFTCIWLGAAAWGCLGLFGPNGDSFGQISLPHELGSGFWRVVMLLPLLGSIYAILFLVGGGVLIKPLSSHLYFFEPFLASILAISGFLYLPIIIGGGHFVKIKTWSKIPLSRILAILVGFSAVYYMVWRLNGGLVLSTSQWGPYSKLRQAFQEKNAADSAGDWQDFSPLRDIAIQMETIPGLKPF